MNIETQGGAGGAQFGGMNQMTMSQYPGQNPGLGQSTYMG